MAARMTSSSVLKSGSEVGTTGEAALAGVQRAAAVAAATVRAPPAVVRRNRRRDMGRGHSVGGFIGASCMHEADAFAARAVSPPARTPGQVWARPEGFTEV